jgi:hypothetical protein
MLLLEVGGIYPVRPARWVEHKVFETNEGGTRSNATLLPSAYGKFWDS